MESFDLAALKPLIAAEEALLRGKGIGAGDRVGWIGLNHPGMLACLFACESIGAVLVPLNWRLAAEELQWIAEDAGLALLREGPASGAVTPQAMPGGAGCEGGGAGGFSVRWGYASTGGASARSGLPSASRSSKP